MVGDEGRGQTVLGTVGSLSALVSNPPLFWLEEIMEYICEFISKAR